MILFIENVFYSGLLFLLGGSADDSSVQLYLPAKISSEANWTMTPVRDGNYSLIDRNKDVVFFIHGFNEDSRFPYFYAMYEELLKRNVNVIAVDWKQLAKGPNYVANRKNIEVAARFLADYIQILNLDVSRIHMIGFSLGAHMAGLVGKQIKEQTGKLLERITGLDPAGPMFGVLQSIDENQRLAPSDARLVVCLHANRGLYGTAYDVGAVNFYANNALLQPGCIEEWRFFLCSHRRSVHYFTESVNSQGFVADRIDGFSMLLVPEGRNRSDQLIFGLDVPETARGKYYFDTNSEKPFARN